MVTDISGGTGSDSEGDTLLDDLHAYIAKFVAFPSIEAGYAVTAWTVHTHALDCFDTTPRLALLSPEPGSGKTRALEVIEPLVPNAMPTFNASAAVLFRSMTLTDERGQSLRPTVLLDEADTIFGPRAAKDHEDLRGFINAGYRRGANAQRVAMVGKRAEIETFPAFAAVAIAGLDDLPDTVMTRSIVIRMRRRSPDESVLPYRRRTYALDAARLADRCNRFCASHYDGLGLVIDDLPPGIEDRAADIWEPLILIGDAAGPKWSSRIRQAAVALVGQSQSTGETLGIRLLSDLRSIFNGRQHVATTSLLADLNALDDAPWGDLRGRPLDARGLSQRLRKYGAASRTLRVGSAVAKGYAAEDLHDPWSRYLPPSAPVPPEISVTWVTSVTPDRGEADDGATAYTSTVFSGDFPELPEPLPDEQLARSVIVGRRLSDPSDVWDVSSVLPVNEPFRKDNVDKTSETSEQSQPALAACPHGIENGHLPDAFLNGRVACPQCAMAAAS